MIKLLQATPNWIDWRKFLDDIFLYKKVMLPFISKEQLYEIQKHQGRRTQK